MQTLTPPLPLQLSSNPATHSVCYSLLASVQLLIGLPVAAEEPVCAEIRTVEVRACMGTVVVVGVVLGDET